MYEVFSCDLNTDQQIAHLRHHWFSVQQQEFDYDKIFQILKDANYRGFFNAEYEGQEEEMEYIPVSIDMIKRYAAKYDI